MKPLKDYSFVRGVCHNPPRDKDWARLEKELSYCKRLNINSTRFWMDQEEYEKDILSAVCHAAIGCMGR